MWGEIGASRLFHAGKGVRPLKGYNTSVCTDTRPLQIVVRLLLTLQKLSGMHASVYWTLVL